MAFPETEKCHQEEEITLEPQPDHRQEGFLLAAAQVIDQKKATCRAVGCEKPICVSQAPSLGTHSGYPRT